jgi:hypothetical protein
MLNSPADSPWQPPSPAAGTGKSELVNALLERNAARTSAFSQVCCPQGHAGILE